MKMGKYEETVEDTVDYFLDDHSFEELLELFDLTPTEVFMILFREGLIDEDILDTILLGGFNE